MLSPLEQFNIEILLLFCSFFWLTNSSVVLLLILSTFGFVFLIFINNQSNIFIVPTKYQYLIEQLFLFIKNLINLNVGSFFLKYFIMILSVFFFILFANLVGMVPYSFTVTSHLIITFALSFLVFFAINFIGFSRHGLQFFSLFFPAGSPLFLAPLLVFIELLSYIARVFSLAIRLFANLMSGHTLLKILSEFAWVMLTGLGLASILFIFPIFIIFLITGLEIAIACLQAYVFTILVCIYLNDSINLH